MVSNHLYRIKLRSNNHRVVLLEFRDSLSAADIDITIRNIFGIRQWQEYTVSYVDKCTGENVYFWMTGQVLAEYVMLGIEVFDLIIHPSVSQVPAGKLHTTFIFSLKFQISRAVTCRWFEKYRLSIIRKIYPMEK